MPLVGVISTEDQSGGSLAHEKANSIATESMVALSLNDKSEIWCSSNTNCFLRMAVVPKQASLRGLLSPFRETCCFASLALTQLLHPHFVCLATKHPPEHVVEPRGVRCAPTLFSNRDEVALVQK